MLHWYKIQDGWIKIFDISVALLVLYRLTFIERLKLAPIYQTYWLYVFFIVLMTFIINEIVFYVKVRKECTQYTTWPLRLLNYTKPDTKERESCLYRSVFTHILFIHLLPTITFGSFVILSNNFSNTVCDSISTPLL